MNEASGQKEKSIIIVGGVNTLILVINDTSKEKITKNVEDVSTLLTNMP